MKRKPPLRLVEGKIYYHVLVPSPTKANLDTMVRPRWAKENCKGNYRLETCNNNNSVRYTFELQEDAVAFKLRWG